LLILVLLFVIYQSLKKIIIFEGERMSQDDFCEHCYESYTEVNPKYEDYPICVLCASKIAVMVLSETVARVMSGKAG